MGKSGQSYNAFYDKVKKHLSKFNNVEAGDWKGEKYTHILSASNVSVNGIKKSNFIFGHNVLPAVKDLGSFLIEGKLHQFAHHLNSSQIMCYNFFRPFIEESCKPTSMLIELLQSKLGISIEDANDASCSFEYEQNDEEWTWKSNDRTRKEGTNFDFYIKAGEKEVFFEVKYTERGFGRCADDKGHQYKFDNLYKKKIDSTDVIKKEQRKYLNFETFIKHYQLFRNILRATSKNKYVIFIYPEDNSIVRKQYEYFVKNYVLDGSCEQIKGVFWEDLLDHNAVVAGFKEKYFGYK